MMASIAAGRCITTNSVVTNIFRGVSLKVRRISAPNIASIHSSAYADARLAWAASQGPFHAHSLRSARTIPLFERRSTITTVVTAHSGFLRAIVRAYATDVSATVTGGGASQSSARSPSQTGLKAVLKVYLKLSKPWLSTAVLVTTVAGYFFAPLPESRAGGLLSDRLSNAWTFTCTLVGTALCVFSANVINQILEVPYDMQMTRTSERPLVRASISLLHARLAALVAGIVGPLILLTQVNGVTAGLGLANIILYGFIYTPMKRTTIHNTAVGAIVGAIPPLMGCAARTGSITDPSGIYLGFLLFGWQFPHFNALSWMQRDQYAKAGYKMMAVSHPQLTRKLALGTCAVVTASSFLPPLLDLTTWAFAPVSLVANSVYLYGALKFYRSFDIKPAQSFYAMSKWYLPVVLVAALACKKTTKTVHSAGAGSPAEGESVVAVASPTSTT
eukprot:Opistho-2@72362